MNATAKISCPGCGHAGRKVGTVTTDSVLVDAARKRAAGRALLFCRTNDCDVIYFDEQREETFGAGELRVTVFQKSA
ncbi:MAG: (2Fe-2S)-binding protein, partial [Deltaproteobacteria bacterium]